MKLSVENYVPRERVGDLEGLKMIKDAGFDCVDYSFYWAKEDFPMYTDQYRAYAQEVRACLDSIGLRCNQAHAPFPVTEGGEFSLEDPAYRRVVQSVEAAAVLGADAIIVHLASVPADSTETEFDYNVRFYKSLEPYAAKSGIRIAVENLFSRDKKRNCIRGRLGSPAELNAMLKALNSHWFVACLDLGHASITGFEPEDFIRKTDPKILRALHVQDTDYLDDRHQLPFLAKLNWPEIMKALGEYGYEGDFTFELTGYLRPLPAELLPEGLHFAHSVGQYLLNLQEVQK